MSRARSIPSRDAETVETELMLADLDSLERRVDAASQEGASGGDKEAKAQLGGHGAGPGGSCRPAGPPAACPSATSRGRCSASCSC